MREYIDLLRNRQGFRYLWVASVVSLAGDWFNTIASVIIVNRYTNSGLAISWILIAKTIPRFFLSPFAGVVADRFNRKTVLVVCDVLRAAIVLSFLFVDRPERVWLIYVLTTFQIVVSSFFEPAALAITPKLVEGNKEILAANVFQSVTWSVMLAVGSSLGGIFAAAYGAEYALVVDSLSYVISAILILQIKYDLPIAADLEVNKTSGFKEFLDGLTYITKRANVAILTLIKTMGQIGSGDIIIAVYAERLFTIGKEGAGSLGIMFAASGVGAVIGPVLGKMLSDDSVKSLRKLIMGGYILIPLAWLVIGLAPNLWVASLGFVLRLAGSSLNWTYSDVLIQLKVPDQFLGRVFALDIAFFTVASSLSVWLTGYLVDTFNMDPRRLVIYFAIGGIVPILIWAFALWYGNRPRPVGIGEEERA